MSDTKDWGRVIEAGKNAAGVEGPALTETGLNLEKALEGIKQSINGIVNEFSGTKLLDNPQGGAQVRLAAGAFLEAVSLRLSRKDVSPDVLVAEFGQVTEGLEKLRTQTQSVEVDAKGKTYGDVVHVDNQLAFLKGLNEILIKIGAEEISE